MWNDQTRAAGTSVTPDIHPFFTLGTFHFFSSSNFEQCSKLLLALNTRLYYQTLDLASLTVFFCPHTHIKQASASYRINIPIFDKFLCFYLFMFMPSDTEEILSREIAWGRRNWPRFLRPHTVSLDKTLSKCFRRLLKGNVACFGRSEMFSDLLSWKKEKNPRHMGFLHAKIPSHVAVKIKKIVYLQGIFFSFSSYLPQNNFLGPLTE